MHVCDICQCASLQGESFCRASGLSPQSCAVGSLLIKNEHAYWNLIVAKHFIIPHLVDVRMFQVWQRNQNLDKIRLCCHILTTSSEELETWNIKRHWRTCSAKASKMHISISFRSDVQIPNAYKLPSRTVVSAHAMPNSTTLQITPLQLGTQRLLQSPGMDPPYKWNCMYMFKWPTGSCCLGPQENFPFGFAPKDLAFT